MRILFGTIFSLVFLVGSIIVGTLMFLNPWAMSISLVVGAASVIGILHYTGYFKARLRKGYRKNDDLLSAMKTTHDLFSEAKQNIKILSGYLHAVFYSSPVIVEALKDATKRGVRIQILAGPDYEQTESNFPFLNLLKEEGQISLAILPYTPERHFMVVDDKHFRRERKHKECSKEEKQIQAVVYYNNPFIAKSLSDIFDRLAMKVSPASHKKHKMTLAY